MLNLKGSNPTHHIDLEPCMTCGDIMYLPEFGVVRTGRAWLEPSLITTQAGGSLRHSTFAVAFSIFHAGVSASHNLTQGSKNYLKTHTGCSKLHGPVLLEHPTPFFAR